MTITATPIEDIEQTPPEDRVTFEVIAEPAEPAEPASRGEREKCDRVPPPCSPPPSASSSNVRIQGELDPPFRLRGSIAEYAS